MASLYLISDNYPVVRATLLKWLTQAELKGSGYFRTFRQIFKAAEFREDAEMLGIIAHRIQKYMIKKYFMGENPEIDPDLNQSFANYFASHLNYHHQYSRRYLSFINDKIKKIENNSGKFQKLKKEFDQYSFWLCSNYFSLSCNQALPNALTMLNPRENPYQSGGSFSLLAPLRDFLTDSSLTAPLNLAATKIRNILREARAGEFKGETHLYREIFDSFKHFGVSNSQAREKTWLILGIYGTRGSAINSFIDILHEECL